MRYTRKTPDGQSFSFKCPADLLPETTLQLASGLADGSIEPDVMSDLRDDEDELETFQRLREDLLARLETAGNQPLEKDYENEKALRHNINWISIENL